MTSSLQLTSDRLLRKSTFGWRYGSLPARLVTSAAIVAALALAAASWQAVRDDKQADRVSARLTALQSARAASAAAIRAAEPPDVVQTLPFAPSAAQIVQTLQREADKESAQVMSLQAEEHPATATALGHLDLTLAVKAPYPAIVTVIQQVLDRYPGATLRQILVTPVVSAAAAATPVMAVPAATGASAAQPMTPSEAHLTLAFWRRPLGVEAVGPVVAEQQATPGAVSAGASAPVAAVPAASAGGPVASMAVALPRGVTALAPINAASSAPRK